MLNLFTIFRYNFIKFQAVLQKTNMTSMRKSTQELQDLANKLRIHSINATTAAKSGHPTSCSSMAEIITVLFFEVLRYKISDPRAPGNDRFILSKGHAAPILYAAWSEAGLFPADDLLNLRKFDSDLEGHPTPRLNFVDVGTGSLGQGLSNACGMAYVGKNYDKIKYRVYCVVGDGEASEGSIWEALSFASYYQLDNLCVVFDINRLGQSEPTPIQYDLDTYQKRLESFGQNVITVDGHDVVQLFNAFVEAAAVKGKPTSILAKTIKGKSYPGFEDDFSAHGKPLGDKSEQVVEYLTSLMGNQSPTSQFIPKNPCVCNTGLLKLESRLSSPPNYTKGDLIATRVTYGIALTKLVEFNKKVIALDGDVKNSTHSETMKKRFPENFIECFIAEQNLVGVAIGAGTRNRTIPFVSTFSAFLTRAFDQIRMGAISQSNVNFVGSHSGVSIGEDGPSQMGLEDIALFRSIPGSTIFYPCDAVSTERAVELAANTSGICYIRTSRPTTPVIYNNDHQFVIGKMNVLTSSEDDQVLVVTGGVTISEAQKAAEILKSEGINISIADLFTIKPIDKEALITEGKRCKGRILTVEDHYVDGGLGDAVLAAVSEERDIIARKLGITEVPRSGPGDVLMDKYGINGEGVSKKIKEFILV